MQKAAQILWIDPDLDEHETSRCSFQSLTISRRVAQAAARSAIQHDACNMPVFQATFSMVWNSVQHRSMLCTAENKHANM